MSASGRLRDADRDLHHDERLAKLLNALPEILAVVEIAEEWVAPGRSYVVDFEAAASGEVADLNAVTRAVLAALEAKLS